jgi:hypothetical protein
MINTEWNAINDRSGSSSDLDDNTDDFFSTHGKNTSAPTRSSYIENHINRTIKNFEDNPTDKFVLNGYNIFRIPDIVSTYNNIKHLEIRSAHLDELPKLPPNVAYLVLTDNNLSHIEKNVIPSSTVIINLSSNKLTDIDFISKGVIRLIVKDNLLCQLGGDLSTVVFIDASDNKLLTLDNLPVLPAMKMLCIDDNKRLESIDSLASTMPNLNVLSTCMCHFTEVSALPEKLNKWQSNQGYIRDLKFDKFPDTLEVIDLGDNNLIKCPHLPENVKKADLAKNQLTEIVDFYDRIEILDLRDNPRMNIPPHVGEFIDKLNTDCVKVLIDNDEDNAVITDYFNNGRARHNRHHGYHQNYHQNYQQNYVRDRHNMNIPNASIFRPQPRPSGIGEPIVFRNFYTI